ncbi:MAG: efflux RND transporter periplasmic adaptor subunit [Thermonemataceae bacterium]
MRIKLYFLYHIGLWIILQITACSSVSEQALPPPPKKVGTVKAELIDYQQEIFATGMLSLSKEVKLSFKTPGIIERISVEEGTAVKAGHTLAIIKLQEVSAQVANAQLQYESAQRDLTRTQALFKDSVATLEQLQNAQTQLEAARNTLSSANFNLRYAQITAPYDGIILRQLANENELVGAGTPIFLFGTRSQEKILNVNLTAREIGAVAVGDTATITFDALEGKVFRGRVTEKSEIADPQTNTFSVEIQIDDAQHQLYSGFVGKAYLATSTVRPLVRIPIDALNQANGKEASVYTLEEGRVHKKSIQIFSIQSRSVLIEKGLQPNERVIVEGVGYLHEGDSISTESIKSNASTL